MAASVHTIHTFLTTRYARSWTLNIRELIQNAFDGVRAVANCSPDEIHSEVSGTAGQWWHVLMQAPNGAPLLQIRCLEHEMELLQAMPPQVRLPHTALMLHSDKSSEAGDIGGFGEGMKICILHLLMHGYQVMYEMYQCRWVFRLQPMERTSASAPPAAQLVVDEYFLPHRTGSLLQIYILGGNCPSLFDPTMYLRFCPYPELFRSSHCHFLDIEKDRKGAENKKKMFVNGVLLKESATLSFHVELCLPVSALSPDRDCIRGEESALVSCSIESILVGDGQVAINVQDACYEAIERAKGRPANDLKSLSTPMRMEILKCLQRMYDNENVRPIVKNADQKTRDLYGLLGYVAVETEAANYYMEDVCSFVFCFCELLILLFFSFLFPSMHSLSIYLYSGGLRYGIQQTSGTERTSAAPAGCSKRP